MDGKPTIDPAVSGRDPNPSVLLAGASGTLGRKLVPALATNHEVTALVRPGSEAPLEALGQLAGMRSAQVTDPDSLVGICDGFDAVVTTVGITRQRDGLTYEDVDFQANLNLLREAERAEVGKFLYVSVVGADKPSRVPGINAKHWFEQALQASSIDWVIVRPSGFFTDLLEVLAMAQRGTVFQFGDGNNVITPIDVADLATVISGLLAESRHIATVGGPETLTWNEIARRCFTAAEKRERVVHLPKWILNASLQAMRPFSKSRYGAFSFVAHVQTGDTSAPEVGTRTFDQFLADHIKQAAVRA